MRRDGGARRPLPLTFASVWAGVSLVLLTCVSTPSRSEERTQPFTVADSIAMTRIVDPDVALAQFQAPTFNVSPDGRAFVVVTRRGNLGSGLNEYALVLFHMTDVRTFVNTPTRTELPRQEVLASFSTSSAKHAIDDVQWLPDSQGLAFVGRGADSIGRVYVLDLRTRQIRQVSQEPRDIARFSMGCDGETLLYSAVTKRDWSSARTHGYVVQSETLSEVVRTEDAGEGILLTHVLADLRTGKITEISVPPNRNYRPEAFSSSPSCRWAVGLLLPQHIPSRWRDYAFIRRYLELSSEGRMVPVDVVATEFLEDEAFGGPSTWLAQYYRFDLTTGLAEPLLDAPAPRLGPPVPILWSSDGRRVIVPHTFLPLDTADPREHGRRAETPAIAEIDLETGTATRVADVIATVPETGAVRLIGLDWTAENKLLVRYRAGAPATPIARSYRKVGGQWLEDAPTRAVRQSPALELAVMQDMGRPPEIVAHDRRTARRRAITDLNPQLRQLTLGRVQEFTWQDRLGRTFTGGLVFPPCHQRSKRYPVVIQTYGFAPTEFLIDGPNGVTTAYAARAIANRDILVLQIPQVDSKPKVDAPSDYGAENDLFVAAIEGVIDALDAEQLIDRKRVGLIGWSREGMHVQYAVTFSNHPIAAATIADSVAATPFCYAAFYGKPYPAMLDFERADGSIGAPFWGEGLERWLQRSYIFHLDRIRTPTRYEHLGLSTFPCHWDVFALLKRYGRPVEMIHIPLAAHNIQQPRARYLSQQGNVDWFAFWLKGEEDTDPAKADQYRRWRKLRELQAAQRAAPSSAPLLPAR